MDDERSSGITGGGTDRVADDDGLIRLAVPVGPDDHVRGSADAPVTLVEYGDFECPYCGIASHAVSQLEKKYGDRLRVVFRSFPLEQHRYAQAAAEAAEFAADHGKFWELHDTLYRHQRALDEEHLLGYARDLGLDPDALATALREKTYAGIIEDSKAGGEDSGIPGTPAFFLNGVLFEDEPTRENFENAIDWLLEYGTHS
jgi:protein-disulfide isomerase